LNPKLPFLRRIRWPLQLFSRATFHLLQGTFLEVVSVGPGVDFIKFTGKNLKWLITIL
jgi:hypothetical protein